MGRNSTQLITNSKSTCIRLTPRLRAARDPGERHYYACSLPQAWAGQEGGGQEEGTTLTNWLACPAGTWPWTHSHRRWRMAVCHGVCWRAPTVLPDPQGQRARLCPPPQNYVSCHDPDYHEPLRWPDVPYQILGGPTENKIVFDQRNGIYIFFISIVDPSYR